MLIYGAFGRVACRRPPNPPGMDPGEHDSVELSLRWTLSSPSAHWCFAGEYGWNTWKLIIPARWQLIAAKWMVHQSFLTIALIATDLILR